MRIEIVFAPSHDDPMFTLFYGLVVGCILILFVLWDRRYRRQWQQFRAKDWPKVEGVFVPDEGEIVTMRRGSSKSIAGYEAQLYYEYRFNGEQYGIFRRFFSGHSEAESFLRLLDGQKISVRVNQRNPSKSCIMDQDLEPLLRSRASIGTS
jgi:hypothetical protein